MYNGKIVIPVLLVFLGLLTYPMWAPNQAEVKSTDKKVHSAALQGAECVEDADWMRANHMQLLDDWRHSVVRDQDHIHYSSVTGKAYEKSLTNTCLGCHGSSEQFCDQCHEYTSVEPYCWECHLNEPPTAGQNPHRNTSLEEYTSMPPANLEGASESQTMEMEASDAR